MPAAHITRSNRIARSRADTKVVLAHDPSMDSLVEFSERARTSTRCLSRAGFGVAALLAFWVVLALLAAELGSATISLISAYIVLTGVVLYLMNGGHASGRSR